MVTLRLTEPLPNRLESIFWRRHSNPKSGRSRVPTGPILVYTVYRRNWRLLLVGIAWTVLNPILFSPPAKAEAWMTRTVLAEQWWIGEEETRTLGLDYPNICNAAGAFAFISTLYCAWQ